MKLKTIEAIIKSLNVASENLAKRNFMVIKIRKSCIKNEIEFISANGFIVLKSIIVDEDLYNNLESDIDYYIHRKDLKSIEAIFKQQKVIERNKFKSASEFKKKFNEIEVNLELIKPYLFNEKIEDYRYPDLSRIIDKNDQKKLTVGLNYQLLKQLVDNIENNNIYSSIKFEFNLEDDRAPIHIYCENNEGKGIIMPMKLKW